MAQRGVCTIKDGPKLLIFHPTGLWVKGAGGAPLSQISRVRQGECGTMVFRSGHRRSFPVVFFCLAGGALGSAEGSTRGPGGNRPEARGGHQTWLFNGGRKKSSKQQQQAAHIARALIHGPGGR